LIGYLKPIVLKFYRVLALGWVPSWQFNKSSQHFNYFR
jgi:hypothetical protein